ncbi:hypothetical protein FIBSPDRAFT_894527 [Athelia psychrophila]|uniref:Uncharacterized protein n=1 Tax=Athelia psychrophila TaxID=1759441 RepID=A0A166FSV4_9AGAM|nr:hypothetical protein FIBSPDRAFT_894527 [Fibularhizoctonia sp. CBS 109695]
MSPTKIQIRSALPDKCLYRCIYVRGVHPHIEASIEASAPSAATKTAPSRYQPDANVQNGQRYCTPSTRYTFLATQWMNGRHSRVTGKYQYRPHKGRVVAALFVHRDGSPQQGSAGACVEPIPDGLASKCPTLRTTALEWNHVQVNSHYTHCARHLQVTSLDRIRSIGGPFLATAKISGGSRHQYGRDKRRLNGWPTP